MKEKSNEEYILSVIKNNSGVTRREILSMTRMNPKTLDRWMGVMLYEKKITRVKDEEQGRQYNYFINKKVKN